MILTLNLTRTAKSKLIWITSCIIMSLSFVFIANDNSFYFLLKDFSFYTDIIFSMSVTFGIAFYLNALNIKLDKSYPWYEMFKTRFFRQFIWGVLLPLIFAMFLEIIYLKAINISFFDSSILNLELPLAFIFLLLLNLILLASYLLEHKQKEIIIIKEEVMISPPKYLEYINVQKGFVEEKVEVSNCALIMSANKLLWLQTFEGEKYRLLGTLEEWEEKLKHSNFYRINRQYLSSFKAIKSIEQTETRKLKVNLVFPTDEIYISKSNVVSFRQWWKQ